MIIFPRPDLSLLRRKAEKILNRLHQLLRHLSGRLQGIPASPVFRRMMPVAGFLAAVFSVLIFLLVLVPVIQQAVVLTRTDRYAHAMLQAGADIPALRSLEKANQQLERKLASLAPRTPYLIINTTDNHFVLRNARGVIRQGLCSTGSYIMLEAGKDQTWIFRTPRGVFRVQGKTEAPVWKKPDWAFVEEGLPVPPAGHPSRYEYGVLGEYALSIGNGYLIHGTLYKRFLGQPVTHGCVRLNDEDLKAVYTYLGTGSKVFIY